MQKLQSLILKVYRHFMHDSLYRNSIYLMMSTAALAFFGFIFWIMSARIYSTENVGLATALISVTTLITNLGMLGFNQTIIRFLNSNKSKNSLINTSITTVSLSIVIISVIYLLFVNFFNSKLNFIHSSYLFGIFFIIFTLFSSLNTLNESIFIAYKRAEFILIKNVIYSLAKLIFPFFFISLGAFGLYSSYSIATCIAAFLTFLFLFKFFSYKFEFKIIQKIIKETAHFSLGNYISSLLSTLSATVLPLIIIHSIGSKESAYFYMDMMIANFIFIIPLATAQSLFAEGANNKDILRQHLIRAFKLSYLLLVPTVILIILFGKFILLAFGKNYANEGLILLWILALSSFILTINYMFTTIYKIKHRMKLLIGTYIVQVILILGGSMLFSRYNLTGIGIAWFIGQLVVAVSCILFTIKNKDI